MTLKRDTAIELRDLRPIEEFYWATYVPGRTGPHYGKERWYKRHQTIGHAKNAVGTGRSGIKYVPGAEIYQWDTAGTMWILTFKVSDSGELVLA